MSATSNVEVQSSVLAVARGPAFVYICLTCVHADRAEHTGIGVRVVARLPHPTDHKNNDNPAEKYARPKFWSGHGPTDPTGSGGHEMVLQLVLFLIRVSPSYSYLRRKMLPSCHCLKTSQSLVRGSLFCDAPLAPLPFVKRSFAKES